MNINRLADQLKDVPQNKLISYAQNPNSVVPQYLALAEIQRRKTLQAAPQQAPQGTVAEDLLAGARQEQMAQPGVVTLPTGSLYQNDETFNAANGGIVAFAGGGTYDTESTDGGESEAEEMARLYPQADASLFDKAKSGIGALLAKLPRSYEAEKAARSAPEAKRGSHKYEEAVLQEAKRQGVDPNLALHVLYKETGNLKDPETARSKAGAVGVMQLMPKTAKGLGVDPHDPMQNIQGGIQYLKQMSDKYRDPSLAAAAYNAGPGTLDRILKSGRDLSALPKETRNYIAGLAEGGEVKRYADTGYVSMGEEVPYDPSQSLGIADWWRRHTYGTPEYIKAQEAEKKPAKKAEPVAAPVQAPASVAPVAMDRPLKSEADLPVTAPKAEDPFAKLGEILAKREAGLASEKETNKNLALLTAGLKMMAGKSQYAAENIGEAGAQGVATYGALKKQTAEDERDIMAGQLGMAKYKSAAEAQKAYHDALIGQKQEALAAGTLNQLQDNLANYRKQVASEVMSRYKGDPTLMTAAQKKQMDADIAAQLANDDYYKSLLSKLGLPLPTAAGNVVPPANRKPLGSFAMGGSI